MLYHRQTPVKLCTYFNSKPLTLIYERIYVLQVNGAGHTTWFVSCTLYAASLTGFNPWWLKASQRDELPCSGPCLCRMLFYVHRQLHNIGLQCHVHARRQGRSRRSGWSGFNRTTFRPNRIFFSVAKVYFTHGVRVGLLASVQFDLNSTTERPTAAAACPVI